MNTYQKITIIIMIFLFFNPYFLTEASVEKNNHINIIEKGSAGNIIGYDANICIDSKNIPHIIYGKSSNQDSQILKYATLKNNEWVITTIDDENRNDHLSLYLDSNDNSHISYRKVHSKHDYDLMYATNSNSTWQMNLIDDEMLTGMFTDIVTDSQNNPHISYHDGFYNSLRYAYWNGTKWIIQTIDDNGITGSDTSISLDVNDYPHISYYDKKIMI